MGISYHLRYMLDYSDFTFYQSFHYTCQKELSLGWTNHHCYQSNYEAQEVLKMMKKIII